MSAKDVSQLRTGANSHHVLSFPSQLPMVLLSAGTGHVTGTQVSYNQCSEARITPDLETSLHYSIDLM